MELPYSQEGIILASDYFKDRDRILTVYTRDMGKIRVISRGSRSIISKLAPHLKPLDWVNLMLFDGKALITITRASEIKSFNNLKSNLESSLIALYSAELVSSSTLEKLPDEKIFNLLLDLFEYLDSKSVNKNIAPSSEEIVLAFKLKLLDILGLRPMEISEEHGESLRIIEEKFSCLENIGWQAIGKERLGKLLDHSLEDMLNRQVVSFSRYVC
ncbi:DNA repair protein RecO [Patescibacteria group bacterium]|nr:DNA repair protein RecO [Patescibacteria group bacterium]MBU4580718.1 DNA repair protein RecO [Patescibacteria group bacterium]